MGAGPDPSARSGPGGAAFRRALGQFPTGVCVITARIPGGGDLGMTVSSFNSLSLDPPLVLFSIDRRALGLDQWRAAPGYGINVLAEGQRELSDRFARAGANKWAGIAFERGHAGAPRLPGVAACFECRPERQHDGGDHVLFLARVVALRVFPERRPLIFCKGNYNALKPQDAPAPACSLAIYY